MRNTNPECDSVSVSRELKIVRKCFELGEEILLLFCNSGSELFTSDVPEEPGGYSQLGAGICL